MDKTNISQAAATLKIITENLDQLIKNIFPNFNSEAMDVWEWKSHFIPHFSIHVNTYKGSD